MCFLSFIFLSSFLLPAIIEFVAVLVIIVSSKPYIYIQSSRDNSISGQMPDTTAVTKDVLYSRGVVPMVEVVVGGGSVTAIVNVNMQVNY